MTTVDRAWQLRAACRGPLAQVFFAPPRTERKAERASREERAKAICDACPVTEPCLSYALEIREVHGIWGGLTEMERKTLLDS